MKKETRITEASSEFDNLDQLPLNELLEHINNEDAKVHLAVHSAIPQIEKLIVEVLYRMKNGGRLFYIGAGTSGRLGVLDASELPPTFGVNSDMVIGLIAGGDIALRSAVENAEDDPNKAWEELLVYNITNNDSLIGIAASGTTPYVIGGIEHARKNGVLTGCITCNQNSPIAQAAEFPIEATVGPEIITGSTRMKSGTAQKMILNMITTSLMVKLGRIEGNKMVNMQLTNQKLIDRGTQMICDELKIDSESARNLLLKYVSVKKTIDAYKKRDS